MGQVFTSPALAAEILDIAGYDVDYLTAHPNRWTILEPSFGQGVFLIEIITRMCQAGSALGMSTEELSEAIDLALYGVELDSRLFEEGRALARKSFNAITGGELFLPGLTCQDALAYPEWRHYDHIIGNPPYVRVHNMSPDTRDRVRELTPGGGMGELYVAFFSKFLPLLKPEGKLTFITPNSWIRNTSQSDFRGHLLDGGYIESVIDYGCEQKFDEVSTYTAVTTLTTGGREEFSYTSGGVRTTIRRSLDRPDHNPLIPHVKNPGSTPLGDTATVQNGLATLADKVFIKTAEQWDTEGVSGGLLVPIVKGGRLGEASKLILAPYDFTVTPPRALSEYELDSYPEARDYLIRHRDVLTRRSRDRSADWFHFGRSQAISTIGVEKVAVSNSVSPDSNKVSWKRIPAGVAVYSGLIITEKAEGLTLDEIINLIDTEDFYDHCRREGKPISGDWTSISSPVIKRYTNGQTVSKRV